MLYRYLIFLLLITTKSFSQFNSKKTYGLLVDIDTNKYKTIQIGNQVWMAENLNVSRFRNGDTIIQAKTIYEWLYAGINKTPAWCYYEFNSDYGKLYSKLYNWYAVNDPIGIAPKGWHVSNKTEWITLRDLLGDGSEWIAGWKLKSEKGWISCDATNESGFSALPGGKINKKGEFENNFDETKTLGYWGAWWNINAYNSDEAYYCEMNGGCGDGGYIGIYKENKTFGMAIRCVKD